MTFEQLNLYLDSILSLFDDPESARLEVAELYDPDLGLVEFLRELVVIHGFGEGAVYSVKVWLGLSYAELARVFDADEKWVSQVIRNGRTQRLAPYRSATEGLPGGISCFMADQLMSSLIDLELPEVSVLKTLQNHLDLCSDCRNRLEEMRQSDVLKLKERRRWRPFGEEEWAALQRLAKERKSFDQIELMVAVSVFFAILIFGIWFFASKPSVVLNVFEMSQH